MGSLTEEPALWIVDALSKLGFKASSGTWAEGIDIAQNIRIAYRDRAAKKAELVRTVITSAVGGGPHQGKPIEMEPKAMPVGGSDSDIVVFF